MPRARLGWPTRCACPAALAMLAGTTGDAAHHDARSTATPRCRWPGEERHHREPSETGGTPARGGVRPGPGLRRATMAYRWRNGRLMSDDEIYHDDRANWAALIHG